MLCCSRDETSECTLTSLRCFADGQKAGGAEALKETAGRGQLTLEEARQILGVEAGAAWDASEQVLVISLISLDT